jgi:hypothetical protein
MLSLNTVTKLLPAAALVICAAVQAAEEFKFAIVTESRTYERQNGSFSVAGVTAARSTTDVSRVTVALDGMLITGEWEPKTSISTTAKDFKRGSEVPAATQRNKLLMRAPDGSTVTAKIVQRKKPEPPRETRGSGD